MPKPSSATAQQRQQITRQMKGRQYADALNQWLGIPKSREIGSLDNPAVWTAVARVALRLSPNDHQDAPLRKAFDEHNLDPGNPIDWRVLAMLMAARLFSVNVGGRHPKWTTARYCELMLVAYRRRRNDPSLSYIAICRAIVRDKSSPQYFREAGVEGLRKMLRRARSPKYNEAMRQAADEMIRETPPASAGRVTGRAAKGRARN
jgi:hypothetical protein